MKSALRSILIILLACVTADCLDISVNDFLNPYEQVEKYLIETEEPVKSEQSTDFFSKLFSNASSVKLLRRYASYLSAELKQFDTRYNSTFYPSVPTPPPDTAKA